MADTTDTGKGPDRGPAQQETRAEDLVDDQVRQAVRELQAAHVTHREETQVWRAEQERQHEETRQQQQATRDEHAAAIRRVNRRHFVTRVIAVAALIFAAVDAFGPWLAPTTEVVCKCQAPVAAECAPATPPPTPAAPR